MNFSWQENECEKKILKERKKAFWTLPKGRPPPEKNSSCEKTEIESWNKKIKKEEK